MSSTVSQEDPHPQLPTCFTDRTYVEKLVREIHASRSGKLPKEPENAGDSAELLNDDPALVRPGGEDDSASSRGEKKADWRPKRLASAA